MADEEKQEPAKPKKDKGGLPVPLFGLIGFAIVLIALIVNVFLVLGIKSDVTAITEVIASGKLPMANGNDGKENKKKELIDEEELSDGQNNVGKYVADDNAKYFETGRITTNPRSSSRFVVLNLGMFFSENPKPEGEEEEAPKEEHAKDAPESFSPYGKKFDGMVKNIINSQIGSMSLEALQIPRDSLTLLFKEKLKPLFLQQEARLKEIAIIEFIVQ